MTNKQIEVFRSRLAKYSGADLQIIQNLLIEQLELEYEKPENFMYHTTTDNYLYLVYYQDGTSNLFCIGADAYERYMKRSDAIRVERKTKNLFPSYEVILKRHEQKRIRSQIS